MGSRLRVGGTDVSLSRFSDVSSGFSPAHSSVPPASPGTPLQSRPGCWAGALGPRGRRARDRPGRPGATPLPEEHGRAKFATSMRFVPDRWGLCGSLDRRQSDFLSPAVAGRPPAPACDRPSPVPCGSTARRFSPFELSPFHPLRLNRRRPLLPGRLPRCGAGHGPSRTRPRRDSGRPTPARATRGGEPVVWSGVSTGVGVPGS